MSLPDLKARQDCLDLNRHVLAVAPAGSGKTGLLVQRMLVALTTVKQPEQVIAVTFTKKAAAEIRHRVLELLLAAQQGKTPDDEFDQQCLAQAAAVLEHADAQGWQLTGQPQRIMAQTIDGFNSRIANELPLLSSLGGRTAIADDEYSLYEQAVLNLFNDVESTNTPDRLKQAAANWLHCANNRLDQLIEPLTQLLARRDQWAGAVLRGADYWNDCENDVLEAIYRDVQIQFASALGPGTCEQLIDILQQASDHELLAWASDLAQWPQPGRTQAATHHALASMLLTKEGIFRKTVNIKQGFVAQTAPTKRIKELLAELQDNKAAEAAAATLASLPASGTTPKVMQALRDDLLVLLHHLLAQLQVVMGQRSEADFTQIALAAHSALAPEQDQYGEALLRRDEQIRHLLVDEMQDTSQSQVRLLTLLTQTWQPGDGRSLFLVGDPQQSIYAFRKAEVRLFQELIDHQQLSPNLPLHCVELSANFRSAPEVVNWFNTCFSSIFPKHKNSATGDILYSPSVAQRATDADAGVAVHALPAKAQQSEANDVADRIAELQQANPQARIALLAKARSHLPHILEELRARGIHFAGQDIDALTALPMVRDLVATAKALWHSQDSLSWGVMLRAAWVGLSWADMVALSTGRRDWSWPRRLAEYESAIKLSVEGKQRVERFNHALASVQAADHLRPRLPDRVEALWTQLGGPACIDSHDLADARRTLQLLRKHCPGGELADLQALNRAINNLYATPAPGDVEVMTIHKAKGLEFDHVIMVGCGKKSRSDDKPLLHLRETEHGELLVPKPPEHWPDDEIEVARGLYDYVHGLETRARASELLRLLYVAITRARRTLDIYVCADVHKEKGFNPPKGSFAELLRPMIEHAFNEQAPAEEKTETIAEVPRAPRLVLPFATPTEDRLYQPREIRKLLPSERVLSAHENKHGDEEIDIYPRMVGILYHQAMEKICNDGLPGWQQKSAAAPLSLAAGLRRMGLPEPQVDSAVQRVMLLVDKTLNGKNGQWLIASRDWSAAEYPLAGYQDGEWVSASIDRCFIDDDGTLWVIDYKTSEQPVADPELEGWLAQRKEHYRPQLESYVSLMAAMHADKMIKSALYFPQWDRLVEY